MDLFSPPPPKPTPMVDDGSGGASDAEDSNTSFSGVLEVHVHNARNIHNICIYDNQDVYAKLSLTCDPDRVLPTRVVPGGGRNPVFEQTLAIEVAHPDSVLKCEVWMLSRARNLMEDQLLGFALVPVSQLPCRGHVVTREYNLSSTDLFHSPAGTIKLGLRLDASSAPVADKSFPTSTIGSEVVLLDRKIAAEQVSVPPVEYSRIEFPDINIACENQKMVSEYFDLTGGVQCSSSSSVNGGLFGSFLHLGSSPTTIDDDCEMNHSSHNHHRRSRSDISASPDRSVHNSNSGFFSSTTTSLSDDRNSAESSEKKSRSAIFDGSPNNSLEPDANHRRCPATPISKKNACEMKEDGNNKKGSESKELGVKFSAPIGSMNIDAEQSAMQQQIVDMYMRSMQQFTESLAKMKLPMDIDNPESKANAAVVATTARTPTDKLDSDNPEARKKKDQSRVFYGSRAFF